MRSSLLGTLFQQLRLCISDLGRLIPVSALGYCRKYDFRPDACHAMILGSLIAGLGLCELQALWHSEDVTEGNGYRPSFNHLLATIERIDVVRLSDKHKPCNPIPKLLKEIHTKASEAAPVASEYSKQLASKRKASGCLRANPSPSSSDLRQGPGES